MTLFNVGIGFEGKFGLVLFNRVSAVLTECLNPY